MGETWNMNKKEIDRYEIIQRVINKQITQIKAAELLKISPRRLRKLQRRVETNGYDLERILAIHETRTVLTDHTFQYNNCFFVIQNISEPRRLRGMKVEIVVYPNGAMRVFLQNREVEVKLLQECEVPIECTRKEVVWRANRRGHRSPPSTHPWKRTRVHL